MAARECLLLVGMKQKPDNGIVTEPCTDPNHKDEEPKKGCDGCNIYNPAVRTAIKPVPKEIHP